MRVPPTLTSKSRSSSLGRIETRPATWKTRSTPRIARRTAGRSRTSHSTDWYSIPLSCSRRERRLCVSRRSSPRSASRRTTAPPTNPLPPVTSVLPMLGPYLDRRGSNPALAQAGLVEALVLHTADALRNRVEALPGDLVAAVDADAVATLFERLLGLPHTVLLFLEDDQRRLVELLLERLSALVGRVLVVAGQLAGEPVPVPVELLPAVLDLLLASVQASRDLLPVELGHRASVYGLGDRSGGHVGSAADAQGRRA